MNDEAVTAAMQHYRAAWAAVEPARLRMEAARAAAVEAARLHERALQAYFNAGDALLTAVRGEESADAR